MHAGPKPLRPVSEAEARKEREEEEKILLNFKDLYTKRSAGEKSVNALQSTLNLLQKIPENYSLYNYRRDILLDLFQDPSKAPGLLLEELKLNSDVLKEDYKCYAAFAHRHWVYEKILEYVPDQRLIRGLIEKEFKQCEKLLQLDERNFHVWNYRRWVLALNERVQDLSGAANGHAPNFLTAEETADLLFTTRKINQNFSNYSAWHQRSFVLNSAVTRLLGAMPCQEVENHWQEFYRQLRDDVELLCQAIYCDPNDQAAWFYARFVIHLFLQSEKQFNQRRSGDQCAPVNVVDILVSSVVDLLAEENASGNGEDSRESFFPHSFLLLLLVDLLGGKSGTSVNHDHRDRAKVYASWVTDRLALCHNCTEGQAFSPCIQWLREHLVLVDPGRAGMYNELAHECEKAISSS